MTLTTQEPLTVTLGSSGVTPEDVVAVARHNARVAISQDALDTVAKVRAHIDCSVSAVLSHQKGTYGAIDEKESVHDRN